MMNLCRECGKPAAPEYADEHDGLCMACVHRDRYGYHLAMPLPNVELPWATGATAVYIDHDMAQPQSTDPIRDAIDRACVDLLDYGHDPDLDASGRCRICGEYEPE